MSNIVGRSVLLSDDKVVTALFSLQCSKSLWHCYICWQKFINTCIPLGDSGDRRQSCKRKLFLIQRYRTSSLYRSNPAVLFIFTFSSSSLVPPVASISCFGKTSRDFVCACKSQNNVGNPPPLAFWYKNGEQIGRFGFLQKILYTDNITREVAKYTCKVKSYNLTDDQSITFSK